MYMYSNTNAGGRKSVQPALSSDQTKMRLNLRLPFIKTMLILGCSPMSRAPRHELLRNLKLHHG
jgi:hypothetical protein